MTNHIGEDFAISFVATGVLSISYRCLFCLAKTIREAKCSASLSHILFTVATHAYSDCVSNIPEDKKKNKTRQPPDAQASLERLQVQQRTEGGQGAVTSHTAQQQDGSSSEGPGGIAEQSGVGWDGGRVDSP